jgi:hypothetical protein
MKSALSRLTLSLILILTVLSISPIHGGQKSQPLKPAPAAAAVDPAAIAAPSQPLVCTPGDRSTAAAFGSWQTPLPSPRLMPSGGCTFSQCISECNDCPYPKHPYCADYTNCICNCR